jgi:hypothetical protein
MELMSTKKPSKIHKQQETVRNNRDNSLTKEVEFQELEIELAESKCESFIEHKKDTITQSKERLETKSNHLKHKS